MADNVLATPPKKQRERYRPELLKILDDYAARVADDFTSGLDRSAQGFGEMVDDGNYLTGVPRLALGGLQWMGSPVSAAVSPILGPVLQPVGEAVNTYVGQPVERATGYPADITNELFMTGVTAGAGPLLKPALKGTGNFLATMGDAAEAGLNRVGYTARPQAGTLFSGVPLSKLADNVQDYQALLNSLGPDFKNATVIGPDGTLLHNKITGRHQVGGPAVWMQPDGSYKTGIIAYHGSPHDFDKFSMDKIGTGEGAQAYGHGLYFAEAEKVAKNYRDQLQFEKPKKIKDAQVAAENFGADAVDFIQDQHPLYVDDTLRVWDAELKNYLNITGQRSASQLGFEDLKKKVSDLAAQVEEARSKLPKREIDPAIKGDVAKEYEALFGPREDDVLFANWNKLNNDYYEHKSKMDNLIDRFERRGVDYNPEREQFFVNRVDLANRVRKLLQSDDQWVQPPSGVMYQIKINASPSDFAIYSGNSGAEAKAFAAKARAEGFKGIKYLDGVSRKGGSGTYNYVIFDDEIISILKKYGIPMTAGAGGAMMVSGEAMPPELAAQLQGGT